MLQLRKSYQDPRRWFEYGEARNLTSHTYDQAVAQTVFNAALRFMSDAVYLLEQLELKND